MCKQLLDQALYYVTTCYYNRHANPCCTLQTAFKTMPADASGQKSLTMLAKTYVAHRLPKKKHYRSRASQILNLRVYPGTLTKLAVRMIPMLLTMKATMRMTATLLMTTDWVRVYAYTGAVRQ